MDVSKFLKDAKKKGTWTAGVEASKTGGFGNIPDGVYIGQLTQAPFEESKNSNRPQIAFGFLILEGDQADNTKYDYFGLDGERSMEFLARRLKDMGIDPEEIEDPEQIPEVLDNLVAEEPVYKFKLKTNAKSDFQGLIVLKRLEDYEAGAGTGDEDSSEPAQTTPRPAPAPKPAPAAAPKAGPKAKPAPAAAPPPTPVPAAEENVEIEVGMKVTFTHDDKGVELPEPKTGTIKAFTITNEEDGEGTADIKSGIKTWKGISFEYIEFDEAANAVDA